MNSNSNSNSNIITNNSKLINQIITKDNFILENRDTIIDLTTIRHIYLFNEDYFLEQIVRLSNITLRWSDYPSKLKINYHNCYEYIFKPEEIERILDAINYTVANFEFVKTSTITINTNTNALIGNNGLTIKTLQSYFGVIATTNINENETTLTIKGVNDSIEQFKSAINVFSNDNKLLKDFINNLRKQNIALFIDVNYLVFTAKYLYSNEKLKINCSNLIQLIQMSRTIKYNCFIGNYEESNPIWQHLKIKNYKDIENIEDNVYYCNTNDSDFVLLDKVYYYLNNLETNENEEQDDLIKELILVIRDKNLESRITDILELALKKNICLEFWFWSKKISNRYIQLFNIKYTTIVKFKTLDIFYDLLVFETKKDNEVKISIKLEKIDYLPFNLNDTKINHLLYSLIMKKINNSDYTLALTIVDYELKSIVINKLDNEPNYDEAVLLSIKGHLLYLSHLFEEALEVFKACLNIIDKLKYNKSKAIILKTICIIYKKINDKYNCTMYQNKLDNLLNLSSKNNKKVTNSNNTNNSNNLSKNDSKVINKNNTNNSSKNEKLSKPSAKQLLPVKQVILVEPKESKPTEIISTKQDDIAIIKLEEKAVVKPPKFEKPKNELMIEAIDSLYTYLITDCVPEYKLRGADLNKFYKKYPDNKKIFTLVKCEILCNHAHSLNKLKWIADETIPGKGYIVAKVLSANEEYFDSL